MPVFVYEIRVKTNEAKKPGIQNTGTDAAVWVELRGEHGTAKIQLTDQIWTGRQMSDGSFSDKPIWANTFEKGNIDQFKIEHSDLGEIGQIQVLINNDGGQPGWLFDWIYVSNGQNPELVSYFDNKNELWLGTGQRNDMTLDRRPLG